MPTLKHRKPIVYISLAIYSLLSIFIIVEACFGSAISGSHSDIIAEISAFFVNLFTGPQTIEVLKPQQLGTVSDSSYLGEGQIAIGTTTLLSLEVKYPTKAHKDDTYDKTYTVNKLTGNNDDYNIVLSNHNGSDATSFFVDVRIVAVNNTSNAYSININVAETFDYVYDFNIVELAKPSNIEVKLDKTTLRINETVAANIKLKDEKYNDARLRRYLDPTKIDMTSSNEAVATIDKYGVIHALSTGQTTITIGDESFNIVVNDETINKPQNNSLSVKISENSNQFPSLLDYDYTFEEGFEANDYSVLLYADFNDDTLLDKSVSWETSDKLNVVLAPFKYDEEGFPIYHDDDGKPCVRVCGYRKKGEVTITCISNSNPDVRVEQILNVQEAIAGEMKLNIKSSSSLIVGEQVIVSATFKPLNVSNTSIYIEVDNPNLVTIKNNGTRSVSITANDAGTAHFIVRSASDENLTATFTIEISVKETINDDNFTDFAKFMRKFAGHFFLFFVTAVFGFIFFFTYFEDDKKKLIFGLPICVINGFLLAGISELIQYFVPSRSGLWLDVGIDFAGYILAVALSLGIYVLIKYIKRHIENKQKKKG